MNGKFDVKRDALFKPPVGRFEIVDVPSAAILAIDGHGDPNTSPAHAAAVGALYAASYAIKFASKAAGRDLVVAPLEGLWWSENPSEFASLAKADWLWTMFIRQPEWMSAAEISSLLSTAAASKKNPVIAQLRFETFDEGRVVQTMHVGSYDDEAPVIHRLHHEFLPANGLVERGKHHEIYLGDPRRVAPEKLRTILRQPVSPA
ncbi:hypothetical protein EYE40_02830 [Glaciihabitans arcticus]|uniref:GyrI-like small molecule binding domain-containing protein n=1 Tax=Glaciihabitans arcticus TaxID=2668039 RepID=A0A4Q9GS43_9MICO|nr:GyrI-like domain-containing protein [Glaciihabitans arcticus]TBN56418.1 hypothetical protein EYE40_02830 [Glaciihabitans arcticus]